MMMEDVNLFHQRCHIDVASGATGWLAYSKVSSSTSTSSTEHLGRVTLDKPHLVARRPFSFLAILVRSLDFRRRSPTGAASQPSMLMRACTTLSNLDKGMTMSVGAVGANASWSPLLLLTGHTHPCNPGRRNKFLPRKLDGS